MDYLEFRSADSKGRQLGGEDSSQIRKAKSVGDVVA